MKSFTSFTGFILTLIVCASLCACHTSKSTTEIVSQVAHDTLYLNRIQYDSVFINNYHLVDRGGDTIIIQDAKVEYRYRLLKDTIKVHQVDSIPVVKEVTVTKEVKYVPSIYKWALGICITLIIISIIYIVWKIKF